MTEDLIRHQRLLDRLNMAEENLLHAKREMTRAQDQLDYWQKQVNILTSQLDQGQEG